MNPPETHDREKFAAQMREFLRRNFNWFLAVGLVLLLLQDIFGTHGVLAMRRTQQQAAQIRKEINQLDEENRKLQDRVKALKSDPATIERIARQEMHLSRPGELVFETHPDGEQSSTSLPPAPPPQNSSPPPPPAACGGSTQESQSRAPSSACAPAKPKPSQRK
jgi:cell division protein FtsB